MFNRSTNNLERADETLSQQPMTTRLDRLALYDQYGSVAYGIILQILPQAHLAQEVLVDVFASQELGAYQTQPSSMALAILRLARAKALVVKTKQAASIPTYSEGAVTTTADLPKLIFDLSFCQGWTPDQIAGHLHVSKADVLVAIHTYFKKIRQS